MARVYIALALAVLGAPAADEDEEPLRVRVQPPTGVHYVGESLPLTVAVWAEGERPEVSVPPVRDLDLTLVGTDLQPLSATGIGDLVETRNLFRYRYRAVPKRAGDFELPPVKARTKDRAGASPRTRFRVRELPREHRPREFIGGVGAFELAAEAVPDTLRLGQTFEYRIRLTGPAARSGLSVPALSRVAELEMHPEVEVLDAESVADPPSCVFRYRLRPRRAGEAVLPPVAVAAFEPRTGQYVTKVTRGVPVRVVDVPSLSAADVRYGPASPAGAPAPRRAHPAAGYAGLALIAAGLGLLYRLDRGRRPVGRARSAAAARARGVPDGAAPDAIARWAAEGLVEYLGLALDRAPGALTPREAEDGLVDATGDPALGAAARALVERCDAASYGAHRVPADAIATAARALFAELGRRPVSPAALRKTERGSPDRMSC